MKHLFLLILVFFTYSCAIDNSDFMNLSGGTIDRIYNFPSMYVTPRNVDIWLPEGYTESKQYAVVYMHDGQNLFDTAISWNQQEWGVDEVVSVLINENKIKDCIVVGIWNSGLGRHPDYFPAKVVNYIDDSTWASIEQQHNYFPLGIQSDNYLKFIVEELKPTIDNEYSTLSDRDNTVVMGSSMGGLISMYAVCEYPDVFGNAGCMSTHWPGIDISGDNPVPEAFVQYMASKLPDPLTHKFYFDYGTLTLDSLYEPYQKMIDTVMMTSGYNSTNWKTLKFEGHDHTERSWRSRLNEPCEFLLPK